MVKVVSRTTLVCHRDGPEPEGASTTGVCLLARLITTSARTVLVLCLALAGVASLFTVQRLEFVAGRNDLTAADKRYVQLDEAYAREFGGWIN